MYLILDCSDGDVLVYSSLIRKSTYLVPSGQGFGKALTLPLNLPWSKSKEVLTAFETPLLLPLEFFKCT